MLGPWVFGRSIDHLSQMNIKKGKRRVGPRRKYGSLELVRRGSANLAMQVLEMKGSFEGGEVSHAQCAGIKYLPVPG